MRMFQLWKSLRCKCHYYNLSSLKIPLEERKLIRVLCRVPTTKKSNMLYWKQRLRNVTTSENNSSDMTGGYLKGIDRNILLALSANLEWNNISSLIAILTPLLFFPPHQNRQPAKQKGLSLLGFNTWKLLYHLKLPSSLSTKASFEFY